MAKITWIDDDNGEIHGHDSEKPYTFDFCVNAEDFSFVGYIVAISHTFYPSHEERVYEAFKIFWSWLCNNSIEEAKELCERSYNDWLEKHKI